MWNVLKLRNIPTEDRAVLPRFDIEIQLMQSRPSVSNISGTCMLISTDNAGTRAT